MITFYCCAKHARLDNTASLNDTRNNETKHAPDYSISVSTFRTADLSSNIKAKQIRGWGCVESFVYHTETLVCDGSLVYGILMNVAHEWRCTNKRNESEGWYVWLRMKRSHGHQSPSPLSRYVEEHKMALWAGRSDDKSNGGLHTDRKIITSHTGHTEHKRKEQHYMVHRKH
jgi:hypothetical protein